MDLKDRFNNHQNEVDAEAWTHFQLLRRNKKPKRRFFWWFFTGSGLCLLLAGIAFWQWNPSNSNYQDTELIPKNSVDKIQTNKPWSTEKDALKTNTAINKDKTNQKSLTNLTPKVSPKSKLPLGNTITQNSIAYANTISDFNQQKSVSSHHDNLPLSNEKNINPSYSRSKVLKTLRGLSSNEGVNVSPLLKDNSLLSTEEKVSVLDTISLVVKQPLTRFNLTMIESPLVRFLDIPATHEVINSPITKPLKRTKNTLKLSIGHANAFINGFSTENPVDKRGFSIQGAYYHEWNKIIGTGISAGYFKTVDRENPSFQVKDKEIIKYIHADLYLFLYNEQKHKLYAKIGAGLTNTDRILAGFLVPLNGPVERIFQINNLTDIGYSVEGAYEYQLKNNFSIGANFGIISHNDGGWFTDLSIGYHF